MGTRPKATTNMNLSTIASLLLLAAVGTVAYPYEDQVMHWGAHQAPDGAYDSGADDSEDSVVPYEDQVMHWGAHQAPELVQEAPQETEDVPKETAWYDCKTKKIKSCKDDAVCGTQCAEIKANCKITNETYCGETESEEKQPVPKSEDHPPMTHAKKAAEAQKEKAEKAEK